MFNHEENQLHVRHPLGIVRKYIRRYVLLEGAALTIIFISLLFWLGLAFDYGLYKLQVEKIDLYWVEIPVNYHGIDWIQELNDVDPAGNSSKWVRLIFLIAFAVALVFLGVSKVVLRWLREFNDGAIALVLERRFHQQLGDRLITAIELSDPKLAKKYGFSQAMIEKTIVEAVETMKRLPVAAVFDWGRLTRLWIYAGLMTVGVWLALMVVVCLGSFFTSGPMTPLDFGWRYYDVASIWTERNVLLQNSYWPRRAYLEVGRFQPSKENPSDMHVARDDARPALQVRAIEWVVADADAPQGWRALRWSDLPRFIERDLLDSVTLTPAFPDWKIEPDELEPNLAVALFGNETQVRTSGEFRAYFQQPHVKKRIDERGAQATLDTWLDWRNWTVDKIAQQKKDTEVRIALREGEAEPSNYSRLEDIFARLQELVDSPQMSRTLRQLVIPETVRVTFRGEETGSQATIEKSPGNRFIVSLDSLKDSTRFRFRARGEDFYTAPKTIVLVAAPTPANIFIDKEEPAYIYHRLRGVDQSPLRGKKHLTRNQALSTTGDTNTIEVPLGTNLVVHVKTDRTLSAEKSVFAKDPPILDPGFATFNGKIGIDPLQDGFSLSMNNLTRKHDFVIEFFDQDNIRGRRRFKIISIPDAEPQLGNLSVLNVNLRRPKIKAIPQPSGKKEDREPPRDLRDQAAIMGAFLITPDALVPFECQVRDDYGLVRVGYQYKLRKVDFELDAQRSKKSAANELSQASRELYAGAVASIFQYWPGNPLSLRAAHDYIKLMSNVVQHEQRTNAGYQEKYVPSEGFNALLERKDGRMIRLAELDELLHKERKAQPWEFDFKDDRDEFGNVGFDLRKLLPALKSVDPEKAVQHHYLLQISVQASDNNVETGSRYRDENGRPLIGNTRNNKNGYITFLIVSENELLSQIALEEEALFEKLEIAKEKIDAGIVSLQEQQSKLRDPAVDMDNVLNRMNEIRTALISSGNNLREAHQAYKNIFREMEVNRVRQDRLSKIREKIIFPLEDIVMQGSYDKAEEAVLNAHQLVEKDVNARVAPNAGRHAPTMTEAGKQMEKLSFDIKLLLDAMSEGIVEGKLIALLVEIERRVDDDRRRLEILHRQRIEEELRRLLGGDDEKKDNKK